MRIRQTETVSGIVSAIIFRFLYPMWFQRFILLFCLMGGTALSAQIYLGANGGGILGRTGDVQMLFYPKNEDWLSFTGGGGYTAPGPFFFDKRSECLRNFFNHGWHLRAGIRNGITADLRRNHFFWGLQAVYSRNRESARFTYCDSLLENDLIYKNRYTVISAAANFGWTWNVFRKKTVWDKLFIDMGFQIGTPIFRSGESLSERSYISGMGFGPFPFRSLHMEPLLMARYEIWHGRYGYRKAREIRH